MAVLYFQGVHVPVICPLVLRQHLMFHEFLGFFQLNLMKYRLKSFSWIAGMFHACAVATLGPSGSVALRSGRRPYLGFDLNPSKNRSSIRYAV
jgi:hypothetical protein